MPEKQKRSPLARILGFFWALIKFILVLAIIVALGVGIYWGGYYAYWGIVSPIASNTNAINLLQDDLETVRSELSRELAAQNEKTAQLSTQVADYEERITGLKDELTAGVARIAELEEALVDGDQRMADLESELSSQNERVAGYEEGIAGLKDDLDAKAARIAKLEETLVDRDRRIADLETGLSSQSDRAAGLDARLVELETKAGVPAEEIAGFKVQVLLLKASQEAIKARIRLIQNNPGAAKEELGLVGASLSAAFELGDEEAKAAISELQDRLADVMRDIDENPFAAAEELEILWRGIDALIGPSD